MAIFGTAFLYVYIANHIENEEATGIVKWLMEGMKVFLILLALAMPIVALQTAELSWTDAGLSVATMDSVNTSLTIITIWTPIIFIVLYIIALLVSYVARMGGVKEP